jgi:hypothetical protein
LLSTESFLSNEPKQSGISSIKLNSQNAQNKLPNFENEIPPFQEFIFVQVEKIYLKYLMYFNYNQQIKPIVEIRSYTLLNLR